MKRIRDYIQSKPATVMTVPTFLCFIQFISSLIEMVKARKFDYDSVIQLLSSLDGFETVVLFFIMVVLKNKKQ
jgi:hypothetical protein